MSDLAKQCANEICSFDWYDAITLAERMEMVPAAQAVIERTIREAAKPLVEALERMVDARSVEEWLDAPRLARQALAAWREGK